MEDGGMTVMKCEDLKENRFWFRIWAMLISAVVTILLACVMYNNSVATKIKDMVQEGAHPMVAACSLGIPLAHTCQLYFAANGGTVKEAE